MAIYIEIKKVKEEKNIGYYHVFTHDFGEVNFYIGIDKNEQKLYCYLSNDFLDCVNIIDFNDQDKSIGKITGVNLSILNRVIIKAYKILNLDIFPIYISYEA